MKNFKYGWTMAELVVVMVILAILSTLSIQVIKPKKIKVLPFAYASIKNLGEAAKYVLSENSTNRLPDNLIDIPEADSNKTCVGMAETLSLLGDYNCTKTYGSRPATAKNPVGSEAGKPNFQTANLISYSGLENDFTPTHRGTATNVGKCATVEIGMKDIMIDINGDDGENKIGEDQFPLKILQSGEVIPGTCRDISGSSTPSECAGEVFENPVFKKHPSCGSNTKAYINEKYPFAYNVYLTRLVTEEEIASNSYREGDRVVENLKIDDRGIIEVSFAEADCLARNNVLTRTQCAALGYAPADKCIEDQSYCIIRQSRPLSMNIFALPY